MDVDDRIISYIDDKYNGHQVHLFGENIDILDKPYLLMMCSILYQDKKDAESEAYRLRREQFSSK